MTFQTGSDVQNLHLLSELRLTRFMRLKNLLQDLHGVIGS
jgi:hypothetical protein